MTKLQTSTSGILFSTAHKIVRGRIYTILEPYNLNPTYWAIIGAILQAPEGVRLATVAEQLGVKAPLITMLSNDLIEQGLISRLPHHTDGRAKLLVMTPKGKKLATEIEAKLSAEIGKLLSGLDKTEIETFKKTLEIIVANGSRSVA